MRILIAPDAFKGSLTSGEAADAMASGIRWVIPDAEIITMPLADGGEWTLDVLHSQCGGEVLNDILYFNDHGAPGSLIESARLIGLTLPNMQSDAFKRGSAKLGRAMLSALGAGVRDIRITLGGSATVDGGLGLLGALGCRVLNQGGEVVSPDLNGMMQAEQVDAGGIDPRLKGTRITILCDVQNPLYGSHGAVYMYGAQKGIQDNKLAAVEAAMRRWACVCEQTLHGKLPITVAAKAHAYGVKTALISGVVESVGMMKKEFDTVHCSCPSGLSVHQAMANAGPLLQQAAAKWAVPLKS